MAASYYVYVLSSDTGVLHIGVTNDLHRRLEEHRRKLVAGFSKGYRTTRLVYFEETPDIRSAIAREKQLKGWRRSKKLALLRSANPQFRDLSQDWEALHSRSARNGGWYWGLLAPPGLGVTWGEMPPLRISFRVGEAGEESSGRLS